MLKMVDLVVRKAGWSQEEFVERWMGEHAELAKELPGLKKYATTVAADPERAGYDGIVELYFEDSSALKEAFDSEIGQEVMTDAAEFIDMEQGPTVIGEETVQLDDSE